MFANAKTILTTAVVIGCLGGAVPALASDHNGQDKTYGGPVQTWCAISPDCNGWNKFAASPTPTQHKHGHEARTR